MHTSPFMDGIKPEDYPALCSLDLADALDTLAQQGFIAGECRGDKQYSKLRFRREGRQRVRYVRAEDYAAVAAELERLQARTRRRRALRSESRDVRAAIKGSEVVLRAALESSGMYFHGRTLRVSVRPGPHERLAFLKQSQNSLRNSHPKVTTMESDHNSDGASCPNRQLRILRIAEYLHDSSQQPHEFDGTLHAVRVPLLLLGIELEDRVLADVQSPTRWNLKTTHAAIRNYLRLQRELMR